MTALGTAAARIVPVLLASSLNGSIVFLLALAAAALLKEAHPRARHLLWLCAILAYPVSFAISMAGLCVDAATPALAARNDALANVPALLGGVPGAFAAAGWGVEAADAGLHSTATGAALAAAASAAEIAALSWQSVLLVAWLVGAGAGFLGMAAGHVRLLTLTRGEPCIVSAKQRNALSRATNQVGITRPVRVEWRERCAIPFTAGIFRPRVVLPAAADMLRGRHLGSVLQHELWHVRRRDVLSRCIAAAALSLFWFVPFAWLAHRRLLLEQEKACDIGVVEAGVKPRDYAAFILEAARRLVLPVPVIGTFLAGRSRRVLEHRIRSVLQGGKSMKKGMCVFVLAAAAMAMVVAAGGAAFGQSTQPDEAWKPFVGVWVNSEYWGSQPHVQKIVLRADLVGEDWNRIADKTPESWWEVRLHKTWMDARGRRYCQFSWEYTSPWYKGTFGVGLLRLDAAGSVLEFNTMWNNLTKYPEEIDPTWGHSPENFMSKEYFIYYRQ